MSLCKRTYQGWCCSLILPNACAVLGRKREPSTSDDGSCPAVKRRAVSVNAVAAQAEVKSPVKMHWKQVEHEVQEARRQLTRIRAKKCLQSVHAMEADTTKQRWACTVATLVDSRPCLSVGLAVWLPSPRA